MKQRRWWSVLGMMFLMVSILAACSGSKATPGGHSTAKIKVNLGGAALLKSATGLHGKVSTAGDVASVAVDVKNGSETIVAGVLLSNNAGVWSAEINDLPLGVQLTYIARAYDATPLVIFTGSTLLTLNGVNDEVSILMVPDSNNTTLQFLRITQIGRPAQIVQESVVPVSVSLLGNKDETLSYEITPAADGGSFSPSTGSLTLNGTSATVVFLYTAPLSTGTFTHTVRVTDSRGTSVETNFTTNITGQLTDDAVTVQFNPVVTALTAARDGSYVTLAAYVSGASSPSDLTYYWSFSGACTLADPRVNPAVLQGYDETITGTITLTVSNSVTGGSTTVNYNVGPAQFPVNIVTNMPLIPQMPTRLAKACTVAATSGNIIALVINHDDIGVDTLGYFDMALNNLTDTGIAVSERGASIEGDIIAFRYSDTGTMGVYSISTGTSYDTQMTPDNRLTREWAGTNRSISNGRIVYIAGGKINIYDAGTRQNTLTDLQVGPGLDMDEHDIIPTISGEIIAYVGPAGTIKYLDLSTGEVKDTGIQGKYPTIDNGIIAFQNAANRIQYYDIARQTSGLTPFTVRDTGHFSFSNGIVAAAIAEGGEWGDLNGDGIMDSNSNGFLALYDIATGKKISTGIKVCCGPGMTGLVLTYDDDEGCYTWYVVLNDLARQYFGR